MRLHLLALQHALAVLCMGVFLIMVAVLMVGVALVSVAVAAVWWLFSIPARVIG